jgi:hypothetical protein
MLIGLFAVLALIGGIIATLISGNIIIGLGMFLSLGVCYGSWMVSWNR